MRGRSIEAYTGNFPVKGRTCCIGNFSRKGSHLLFYTAKAMQAQFICMAHNLMVLQEHNLEVEETITNTAEIKRKAQRLDEAIAILAAKKQVMPVLQQAFQRHTQRSVKYVRWLRAFLFVEAPWHSVVANLRELYRIS